MPLDIHYAKNATQASKSYPVLSIEYAEHESLFQRHRGMLGQCRLLMRLHDFYADATVSNAELPEFLSELVALEGRVPETSAKNLVSNLASGVRTAIEDGNSMFAYCD